MHGERRGAHTGMRAATKRAHCARESARGGARPQLPGVLPPPLALRAARPGCEAMACVAACAAVGARRASAAAAAGRSGERARTQARPGLRCQARLAPHRAQPRAVDVRCAGKAALAATVADARPCAGGAPVGTPAGDGALLRNSAQGDVPHVADLAAVVSEHGVLEKLGISVAFGVCVCLVVALAISAVAALNTVRDNS